MTAEALVRIHRTLILASVSVGFDEQFATVPCILRSASVPDQAQSKQFIKGNRAQRHQEQ